MPPLPLDPFTKRVIKGLFMENAIQTTTTSLTHR